MSEYLPYAPLIIVIIAYLIQFNVFVSPEKLERKHREILSDADKKFVSLQVFQNFKDDVKEDFKELKRGQREIINTINNTKGV